MRMATIGQARAAIAEARSRAEMYRLWHAGHHAGLTHAAVLETMGQREARRAEEWRQALLQGAKARRTVAAIVKQHGSLTQAFESAVLTFGEESGSLEQSLRSLGDHFEGEHRLLIRLWSKLTYPLFISLVAILIAPLPLVVQGSARTYWILVATGLAVWYGLGGSAIGIMAARYAQRRDFVLGRLARALANGIEAGLPLDRVVTLAADITGHAEIIAHVKRMPVRERASRPVSEIFQGCSVIPPEMISAMRVAELSGDYSGSLRKMAELYDPV